MKEVDWQLKIIHSTRWQGGYGGKWSSSVQVGKPDLILRHKVAGNQLMEVKLFKDIPKTRKFNRQIETTDLQRHELEQHEKAGGLSTVGVVVYYNPRDVLLVVLPWSMRQLDSGLLEDPRGTGKWRPGQGPGAGFDMEAIMAGYIDRRLEKLFQ